MILVVLLIAPSLLMCVCNIVRERSSIFTPIGLLFGEQEFPTKFLEADGEMFALDITLERLDFDQKW